MDAATHSAPCVSGSRFGSRMALMERRYQPSPRDTRRSSLDEIIEFYKRDVDRTLLREQLKKTPDERVRELVELERFADELRRAGKESFR